MVNPALGNYDLESLVGQYLEDFAPDDLALNAPYYICRLYWLLLDQLKEADCAKLFFEVEMPLINVLYDMQLWGVTIDMKVMDNLLSEVDQRLDKVKKDIFTIADSLLLDEDDLVHKGYG